MGHGVIATNTTVLRQLTRSLHAIFREELEGPDKSLVDALRFFMETNSTGDMEDYNWLGSIPAMQEWLDTRPHSRLRQFGQTIRNAEYANGIECHLNEIEDDKLGQIAMKVRSLADGYKTHVWDMFISMLQGGSAALCYDGLPFFSAAHTEGDSGVQGNLGGAVALSDTAFEAEYAKMVEYKDDKGKLMRITPTHLWTTPALMATAKEIVVVDKVASGATNPNAGMVGLIILPGLTTTTNWGLVDLSKSMKPFIKQNRRPVAFAAMDKIDDEMIYNKRMVRYGADYRGGYGYGFWQLMTFNTGA